MKKSKSRIKLIFKMFDKLIKIQTKKKEVNHKIITEIRRKKCNSKFYFVKPLEN